MITSFNWKLSQSKRRGVAVDITVMKGPGSDWLIELPIK